MKKVIDVSKHNGTIEWTKVKGSVDGAIIRLGYRGYSKTGKIAMDSSAMVNIAGCKANKIPYGVYFFPCSLTTAEAIEEAEWIHSQVKGLELSFPIYLDSEVAEPKYGSGRADNLSRDERTRLLNAVLNHLQALGYTVGVYASKSWFTSHLDAPKLPSDCHIWVAQYSSACTYYGKYDAWQYTSKGAVNGINGAVDISHYYAGFESDVKPELKSTGTVAQEVIAGKWGVAPQRKQRLEQAGYDYSAVQKRVNDILSKEKAIKANQEEYDNFSKRAAIAKANLDKLNAELEQLKK